MYCCTNILIIKTRINQDLNIFEKMSTFFKYMQRGLPFLNMVNVYAFVNERIII